MSQGKKVTIASDGQASMLLKEEFPSVDHLTLPSYNVTYRGSTLWSIVLMNVPNVLRAIIAENHVAMRILKNNNYDMIISDSRFGFRHSKVPSYIITHQLDLQSNNRLMYWALNYLNQKLLNAFDLCIVPDYDDSRLSGRLSQSSKIKKKIYIGALSRLKKLKLPILYNKAYILSGPEPARTSLENQILEKIQSTEEKTVLVRGTNRSLEPRHYNPNITILGLVKADMLNRIILQSHIVVSRSGYTSIMDYYTLSKKALLIPTPGQSEQEYLAQYLDGKYGMIRLTNDRLL